jgi:PqqD family protein of HPr-rel-A system
VSLETSPARVRWRFTEHPDVRVVRFGAEAVVFNPLSRETHLLNETAAHVVDSLRRGPQSAWELAAALAEDLDPESAPEVYAEQVASLMEDLEGFGLAVRMAIEETNAAR